MPDSEEVKSISSAAEVKGNEVKPDADSERELLEITKEKHAEDLRGQRNDNRARVIYANRIFYMIALWLVAVLLILLFQGFLGKQGLPFDWTAGMYGPRASGVWHFDLPPEVLLALIGGTTATVLGLFAIVAHYFFPEKH